MDDVTSRLASLRDAIRRQISETDAQIATLGRRLQGYAHEQNPAKVASDGPEIGSDATEAEIEAERPCVCGCGWTQEDCICPPDDETYDWWADADSRLQFETERRITEALIHNTAPMKIEWNMKGGK